MVLEGFEAAYETRLLGMTALDQLTLAAERGQSEVVAAILATGLHVDLKDGTHRSALNWAVCAGQTMMVRDLLSAGADPDQPVGDHDESFPLRWCATRNDVEMAGILIRGGALVEGHPQSVLEVIEPVRMRMRDQGIYPRGEEPHFTSRSPLTTAIRSGFIRMTRLLLEQGIDVEEAAIDPGLPLRDAVIRRYAELVELLIAYGARITPATLKTARLPEITTANRGPAPEVARDEQRTLALLSR